ncbi:prepilin-type N-terminal cleavage/methylation domain-containing protein [Bacillus sp. FJAT-49711]|uniref:prepilin-type N-terminal cleavage/methylation domain-containing protein n=1 Tax=Bacillus sp. FJAT-49711 TaxID=2833585 RepID=UPI001BC9D475|nr:prepilin-type N-terminal cleavage/methylation domain-containing protein [Bacillus sp. FJAT-49711]MBS4216999.1 prepilin-type N-terminal cleavage/methylation domain-containing protein [Bacillus sp. FJAT-49711]
MLKKVRKLFKNQRGLTLVELLAVVVILGIISAIAIPSIGGLINNSKKDAHIANAQTMVNAVKLMVTTDELEYNKNNAATVTLSQLVKDNYIEAVKDPSGTTYGEGTNVTVKKESDDKYTYSITLTNSGNNEYYSGTLEKMNRSQINLKPSSE